MTEQERVEKLKARMSRWQAYVDNPQGTMHQQPLESEAREDSHAARTVLLPDRPQQRYLPDPASSTLPLRGAGRANTATAAPLNEIQEARIADLQTAIAREREQANRLADEVVRAQTLHAATIYANMSEEKARIEEASVIQQTPIGLPTYYDEERRRNLVPLIGILLLITCLIVIAFFLTR